MIVRVLGAAACAALLVAAPARAADPLTLVLDARDVASDILHVHESIPVSGPITVIAPKWIPGSHGPNGSIVNLVNLRFAAGTRTLAYRRDDLVPYAFHVEVPSGVHAIDATFDHLYGPRGDSTTPQLATVNGADAVLYPRGAPAREVQVATSIVLPAGWNYGTALHPQGRDGDRVRFAPTTLETLVDSPIAIGKYLRTFELDRRPGALNEAVVIADRPADEALSDETVGKLKALVAEGDALTGARHYVDYHFLIALSDDIAHFGLEHHESSDDRMPANALTDPDAIDAYADLLPHEFFHSWNGKYRRPAGLATPDYEPPMRDELLWVYEGLTQYYGEVLAYRSGFRKLDAYPDYVAAVAAGQDALPGRATRSLVDTAIAIPVSRGASGTYNGERRGGDYYPEGAMVWRMADMLIRERSGGARSLDDFVRRFHGGGGDTPPAVVPYTRDDVIAAMNAVQPYDWKAFFDERIDAVQPRLQLGELERAGWRLAFDDHPNVYLATRDRAGVRGGGGVDARFTLGASFAGNGRVNDVYADGAAARAGLAPGMRIIAVDGRRFSARGIRDAIKNSKGGTKPIAVIAENAGFVREYAIDYHGGERYPHLARIDGVPDLLSPSVAPKRGNAK